MTFFTAKNIGCFRDTGRRAISPLEGRSRLLKGSYRRRKYAIRKCALAAQKRGFRVFAVQHGGWCAASRTGHLTYRRYGRSNRCRNGKGGPWANDVYVLRGQRKHYLRIFKRILMVLNRNVHLEAGTISWHCSVRTIQSPKRSPFYLLCTSTKKLKNLDAPSVTIVLYMLAISTHFCFVLDKCRHKFP